MGGCPREFAATAHRGFPERDRGDEHGLFHPILVDIVDDPRSGSCETLRKQGAAAGGRRSGPRRVAILPIPPPGSTADRRGRGDRVASVDAMYIVAALESR